MPSEVLRFRFGSRSSTVQFRERLSDRGLPARYHRRVWPARRPHPQRPFGVTRLLVILPDCAFVSLACPTAFLASPGVRCVCRLIATSTRSAASSSSRRRGGTSPLASLAAALRHANLGLALALSCALTTLALLGYALPRDCRLVVALAFVGVGGGGIDAALNTYAATNHGPRTLNLLHARHGIGASIGPMIMTSVLKGNGEVDENPARCCEQDDESLLEEAPRRGRRIAV